MKVNLLKKHGAGFSLVELLTALALVGVLTTFTGIYINEQVKVAIKNENITKAAARSNQFFDYVSKVLRRQRDTLDLTGFSTGSGDNGLAQKMRVSTLDLSSASTDQVDLATGQTVKVNSGLDTEYFEVTIENQCLPYPANVPSLIDLGLTQPEIDELLLCSGCVAGQIPRAMIGIVSTSQVKLNKTFPALPGDLTGLDGNPITAVVCLRTNGSLDSRDTESPVKLKSKASGYCLSTNATNGLIQGSCSSSKNFQLIKVNPPGVDRLLIQMVGGTPKFCLRDQGSGILGFIACDKTSPSQTFSFALPPGVTQISSQSFFKIALDGTTCLAPVSSSILGSSVTLQSCENSGSFLWEIVGPANELKMTVLALAPFRSGDSRKAKVVRSQTIYPIKKFGPGTIRIIPSVSEWTDKPVRKSAGP